MPEIARILETGLIWFLDSRQSLWTSCGVKSAGICAILGSERYTKGNVLPLYEGQSYYINGTVVDCYGEATRDLNGVKVSCQWETTGGSVHSRTSLGFIDDSSFSYDISDLVLVPTKVYDVIFILNYEYEGRTVENGHFYANVIEKLPDDGGEEREQAEKTEF